ncbi:hypothetical protein [Streptodolium elevatio]|uniref:Uncharacterized protein n=1 Tax=Streptodolium elevatio TaxID=3157996 RepID=A0ABV3DUF7_9ACTN
MVQGVRAARNKPQGSLWPDAREALMELFVVVDEWCTSAAESNWFARRVLEDRVARDPARPAPAGYRWAEGLGNSGGRFLKRVTKDVDEVLTPAPPWYARWRRSARRASARRTLRSMLRIYCPDVLDSFDAAVEARTSSVPAYRADFTRRANDPSTTVDQIRAMVDAMDDTLRALVAARESLRRVIQDNYPGLNGGAP